MGKALAGVGCLLIVGLAHAASAAELESFGNTDGLLTWNLGTLQPGKSAREVVLFTFDATADKVHGRLEAARKRFAALPEPAAAAGKDAPGIASSIARSLSAAGAVGGKDGPGIVWIRNETTDFALAGAGSFFWEGGRQGLTGPHGGQLSRFGYYLHYDDGAPRRAGTPIVSQSAENLRVLEPIRPIGRGEALGLVETADKRLRIRVRALMGEGPTAAVEFVMTNGGDGPLADVRLTAYSNLESAHTHEDDYSILDPRTGGVMVMDPTTGMWIAMSGLERPVSGYSGVWPSQGPLEAAAGAPIEKWKQSIAVPEELKRWLAANAILRAPHPPAPPARPFEPSTRDLSPPQAAEVLQSDWLFQADNNPTVERALQEVGWTRELAARLKKNPKTPDLVADLAELDRLEKRLSAPETKAQGPAAAKELYLAVRAVKRRIMLANPAVNFSQILFIDCPYPQGSEWPHQARHRNGMMAVPGGRLLVLDGLHPGGHVRKLAAEKPGYFWRPDLSFDARRVVFCYKAHDEPSFHLYEINLDGSSLRQLTSGAYDDIDPIYLPDGHILFTTTRANTYIRCMPYTYCYVLARCDADGKNIYLISQNNEPDWCPALLNDGRVCYSRWEYHDKALWRIESLWTTNQDGTGTATFWGNQSVWPDHLAEPRPIPGSTRVMFTGVAHHDWFAGSIGILDQSKGFNFPLGLTKVTCDVPWPECGPPPVDPHEKPNYHVSGRYSAYKTPYPLSEEDFLVSARRGGHEDKFRLFLMDVYGNRELVYEGHYNVWHAMPVAPRPVPPAHPDHVAWPGTGSQRKPNEPGVLYSVDVYQGVPDLPRGKAKYLRVIQMDPRTYSTWTRDGRFSGPVISAIQDDGVKRILGTVPIQPDGSVAFKAPAGQALHFQLLDENRRALQTMRSFAGVMPGERRGCVGCHEQHSTTPAGGAGLALRGPAAELTPPPWGATSISYERLVQPVLDKYCGKCHQGDGEARKQYDLTLRPGSGAFKEPYLTLVGWAQFSGDLRDPRNAGIAGAIKAENYGQTDPAAYKTLRPMQHLSYTSKLIELASSGKHYDVKIDPVALEQLIGWVDANCPYRGNEEVRAIPDPQFVGVESLPIRPRTQTAPRVPRP